MKKFCNDCGFEIPRNEKYYSIDEGTGAICGDCGWHFVVSANQAYWGGCTFEE